MCDCCAVVFSQLLPGLLGLLVLLCGGYRPLLPREGNTYTSTLSSIIFSLKDLTSVTIVKGAEIHQGRGELDWRKVGGEGRGELDWRKEGGEGS